MADPMTPATLGTHGVHQEEIGGIGLLADLLDTRAAMGTADTPGGADEGVDLAAGEDVHHVAAQEAADGGDCEGHQTQRHDLQGVQGQEPGGHSGGAYGDAQETR